MTAAEDVSADIRSLLDALLAADPADPWEAVVDAGLAILEVPTSCGGEGLGAGAVAEVLTGLGRRALASPALVTMGVAVPVLARWGTPEQQEAALRPLTWSGAVVTVALRPGRGITATRAGDGFEVSGTAPAVSYAAGAHRVLLPLDDGSGLLLLDPGLAGVTVLPVPTSSTAPAATIRLDRVRLGPEALVPGGADAVTTLRRCAAAAAAAYADGLLSGALALTATHVATRHQFGRPLVTLQAVAQQLADVKIAATVLHLAAVAATDAVEAELDGSPLDPDGDADPELAALIAVDHARTAIATCHHLHGGTGVDLSYPLPRFSAAATDLAHLVGGPTQRLDALAGRLYARAENP